MEIKRFDFLCYVINRLEISKADKRYIKKYYLKKADRSNHLVTDIERLRGILDIDLHWASDENPRRTGAIGHSNNSSFWNNMNEYVSRYIRINLRELERLFHEGLIPQRGVPLRNLVNSEGNSVYSANVRYTTTPTSNSLYDDNDLDFL